MLPSSTATETVPVFSEQVPVQVDEKALIDCVDDSGTLEEMFGTASDELSIADAYCAFYASAWDDITHGTQGDFATFIALAESCIAGWTSSSEAYEAETKRRVEFLLNEGARRFVAEYSSSASVIDEHGQVNHP